MAYKKKTADGGTNEDKTKFISKSDDGTYSYKRDRAQIMDFAKL